jgi:transposase
MTIETRNDEYSATLYMALELGGTTWKVGFTVGLGRKPRVVTIPARDTARLQREIAQAKQRFGLDETAPVLSFWVHRDLVDRGIDNVVVEPASVAVDRRARRPKTDRLDVQKLLRHLIRSQDDPGEWRVVRVPSVEQEDERHLHRELETLRNERSAHSSRIKSLLATQGIRMAVTARFLEQLSKLQLPAQLRRRLEREYQRRQFAHEQMLELQRQRRELVQSAQTKTAQQTRRLVQLRALGEASSWTFASELYSWRELRNRRQVGSLLGMTPTPYDSDGMRREQGISKAGLRRVRALAIEIAWCWLRYQPQSQLSLWFQKRFGNGQRSRKIGIVALARRLMIALWHYVEHDVIPEGATLKA